MRKKNKKEDEKAKAKALQERKERDAKRDYQYTPCPYCGEAVRWPGKQVKPETCGKEECQKKFQEERLTRLREEAEKKGE